MSPQIQGYHSGFLFNLFCWQSKWEPGDTIQIQLSSQQDIYSHLKFKFREASSMFPFRVPLKDETTQRMFISLARVLYRKKSQDLNNLTAHSICFGNFTKSLHIFSRSISIRRARAVSEIKIWGTSISEINIRKEQSQKTGEKTWLQY